jgi:hypothetical protein
MGPDQQKIQDAIREIGAIYDITDLGPAKMFLGVELIRSPGQITLSQKRYILTLLKKFASENGRIVDSPAISHSTEEEEQLPMEESVPYAELVGGLLYLSTWTRPDIAFAVGRLARHMQGPRLIDWMDAMRVLNYLRGTINEGITYYKGGGPLLGYTDSDYAADISTRRSTSGVVFMMNGGPILWKSKRQTTVALSTCEAELMASNLGAREAMWLRKLLPELGKDVVGPISIQMDNQGALQLNKHPILSTKSKHIDVQYFWARELMEAGKVEFVFVPSEDNLADICTKVLTPAIFASIKNRIISDGRQDLRRSVVDQALSAACQDPRPDRPWCQDRQARVSGP